MTNLQSTTLYKFTAWMNLHFHLPSILVSAHVVRRSAAAWLVASIQCFSDDEGYAKVTTLPTKTPQVFGTNFSHLLILRLVIPVWLAGQLQHLDAVIQSKSAAETCTKS